MRASEGLGEAFTNHLASVLNHTADSRIWRGSGKAFSAQFQAPKHEFFLYLHEPKNTAIMPENSSLLIREIGPADNANMAKLIRSVLEELEVPKVGTAYEDKALDDLTAEYDQEKAGYFVLIHEGKLMGGAGIGPLPKADNRVCELQKMYFSPAARGKGWGDLMIKKCLEAARDWGYSQVYIETMPFMKAAQKLYVRHGFEYIDGPLGDTGHYSCPVYLLKTME
jgi:putative acetyltransferase